MGQDDRPNTLWAQNLLNFWLITFKFDVTVLGVSDDLTNFPLKIGQQKHFEKMIVVSSTDSFELFFQGVKFL